MNNINKNKYPYISPIVEIVKLDNEISLQLESLPPDGPGEFSSFAREYINNDPFKTNCA